MRDSDISLGDVARAIVAMQPSPGEFKRIASLLGFDSAAERAVDLPGSGPAHAAAPRSSEDRRPPQLDNTPLEPSKRPGLRSELVKLPPEKTPAPWLALEPLERPGAVIAPALEPLLHPLWQRAVLSELAASLWPIGDVDVVAITQHMTSGRPMRALPRMVRRTLSRGAHLLVDRSTSMMPFVRDCQELTAQLQRIAGGTLNLRYFRGVPTREVFGPASYSAPSRGGTVLIASDFGTGPAVPGEQRASLHEWLPFLDAIGSASCLVVALVPGNSKGLSPALRRRMAVVAWERTTTSSRVRAERRRAEVPKAREP